MTDSETRAVVEPPREGRILSADVVKRLRTAMVHRNVLNDLCDSHELLRSALSAAQQSADDLRRAVAESIGSDPETWPDHGNAPLAIAATVALGKLKREELEAALSAAQQETENAENFIAALRAPLLYYCGTTDPQLLTEVLADRAHAEDARRAVSPSPEPR